jgi:dolichol-phosphate mannosyltransferase
MQRRNLKVSVILATYNERDSIVSLLEGLISEIQPPLEIIVVDDNSKDGTADVVERMGYPNVFLIRRRKRGLASAFHRGIIESTGEIICWMDADMCMPPEVLSRMISKLDEYDIAVGSRYVKGGSDNRNSVRVLSSRFINWLARTVLGGNVKDYDSGFVALKREVFNTITLIPFGYGEYFIELIYDAHVSGMKITEVGYAFKDRATGISKSMPSLWVFIKTGLHYVFRIFSLRFRLLRGGN